MHCIEVKCIWRVETSFDSFICSRSYNLALIQLFDELPQLHITVSFCQSFPLSHASKLRSRKSPCRAHQRLVFLLKSFLLHLSGEVKIVTGDFSSTPPIFSRELILSLKATFWHETAQGTPTMLIILLRAVYTPLRLRMSQCRHSCKWTSRSSQLFWVALFVFLCKFLSNEFCLVRVRADPKDKALELISVCWS